jgi:hypothetical protein
LFDEGLLAVELAFALPPLLPLAGALEIVPDRAVGNAERVGDLLLRLPLFLKDLGLQHTVLLR